MTWLLRRHYRLTAVSLLQINLGLTSTPPPHKKIIVQQGTPKVLKYKQLKIFYTMFFFKLFR